MEELRQTEKDAKIIWKCRQSVCKLLNLKTTTEDHMLFTIRSLAVLMEMLGPE